MLRQAVDTLTDGHTATLGLRLEDLVLSPQEKPDASLELSATVRLVEPLGHENIVHCEVGGVVISARANNEWAGEVGSQVTVSFSGDRLYAFDPTTEQSLVH